MADKPTALEDRGADVRLRSPSAARNREPVLGVLRRVLPADGRVLEIASGTGEHAIHFARAMPGLTWRSSDPDAASRASIVAWIESEGLANILPPLEIDTRSANWGIEDERFDAIVSLNMIHIAPWEAALGLIDGAARLLKANGVLFLYGPFKRDGAHTAPSNEAFDASLKSRDPSWGVRDVGDVAREAQRKGFSLMEIEEMPANNLCVVFAR
ncbi:SAM-dependent methyltransferases [alpha proteobacterium U9-1i]|nr:SAM-dependent methyltransferases [alpha proteobacterium U9-1i]